jgi:hypothetical protein
VPLQEGGLITEWDRINKLCEFNGKNNKNTKDLAGFDKKSVDADLVVPVKAATIVPVPAAPATTFPTSVTPAPPPARSEAIGSKMNKYTMRAD